jgi:hypothetical protein
MNKTTGAIKMALDITTDPHVWSLHRTGCTKLTAIARGNAYNVTTWKNVREAVAAVNQPTRVCGCVDTAKAVR